MAEQTLGALASRDKEKVYQMRLRDGMGLMPRRTQVWKRCQAINRKGRRSVSETMAWFGTSECYVCRVSETSPSKVVRNMTDLKGQKAGRPRQPPRKEQ